MTFWAVTCSATPVSSAEESAFQPPLHFLALRGKTTRLALYSRRRCSLACLPLTERLRRRVHDGAHTASDGARGDGLSLLVTCKPPALLAGWLVEPGLDIALPILTELAAGVDLVVVWRGGRA